MPAFLPIFPTFQQWINTRIAAAIHFLSRWREYELTLFLVQSLTASLNDNNALFLHQLML